MPNKLIPKDKFLNKYNIPQEKYETSGLEWDNLSKIYDDYLNVVSNLEPTAEYIAKCLRRVDEVHSLKIRVKNPEHLIEKIIRKKIERDLSIDLENYRDKITDLIGVKALHLFKEDWEPIHYFIINEWELHENPVANIREGDSKNFVKKFKEKECEINKHPAGYRSVHYVVKSQPSKEIHLAEIQVRTIFEEGWSEIDHKIRYPYDKDNPILSGYLVSVEKMENLKSKANIDVQITFGKTSDAN